MQCPKLIQLHITIHAQLAGVEPRPMCNNNMNQPHCIERSLERLVVLNQVIQNVISENNTSSRFMALSIIIKKTVLDTCELVSSLIITYQLFLKLLIISTSSLKSIILIIHYVIIYTFVYLQVNKKLNSSIQCSEMLLLQAMKLRHQIFEEALTLQSELNGFKKALETEPQEGQLALGCDWVKCKLYPGAVIPENTRKYFLNENFPPSLCYRP